MTGNIPLSYNVKIGKKTVIEDVDDDVDKLPDSYFVKAATRVYYKIDNVNDDVLPLSKFVELIETIVCVWGGG